jgi:hypothetical protein
MTIKITKRTSVATYNKKYFTKLVQRSHQANRNNNKILRVGWGRVGRRDTPISKVTTLSNLKCSVFNKKCETVTFIHC